ncbi:VOC family protein [Longispora albida]|uniref:VOC family protein n=1 Tax=Longispora albida TaxID=203523 RepID=UPI0003A3CA23|nr:VOC family protein [Longispora albida]
MSGKIVHFEIPADDLDRAKSFYTEAFGWTLTDYPGLDYTGVTTTPVDDSMMPTEPGAINGGMTSRSAPVTSVTITVGVDDIDEALAKVKQAGGTVVQTKQAVADMGFTGYFTDTEGNTIGLWQNAS